MLSLSRDGAIELDAAQRDSCAGLTGSDDFVHGNGEETGVPIIARWHDVQRARSQAIRDKEGLAIMQLRAGGFSEEEIAKLADRSRMSVRRAWRATVDDILGHLGSLDADELPAIPTLNLCVSCGRLPRVRLEAVTVRAKGGPKTMAPSREASVCIECLSPELSFRIKREPAIAA